MRDRNATTEDLVRYADGQLDRDAATRVEEHLAGSPEARAYVARVRLVTATLATDLMETPSAPAVRRVASMLPRRAAAARPAWLEHAERLVARLVLDQRQPMLAGFRGGGATAQLAYECDEARVDLRLAPSRTPGTDAWDLNGQIALRGDAHARGPVALVRCADAGEVTETTLDERGRFRLSADEGAHDLMIELEEGVIVVPELRVGDG
jgi:anti-sigma factor RsiW